MRPTPYLAFSKSPAGSKTTVGSNIDIVLILQGSECKSQAGALRGVLLRAASGQFMLLAICNMNNYRNLIAYSGQTGGVLSLLSCSSWCKHATNLKHPALYSKDCKYETVTYPHIYV